MSLDYVQRLALYLLIYMTTLFGFKAVLYDCMKSLLLQLFTVFYRRVNIFLGVSGYKQITNDTTRLNRHEIAELRPNGRNKGNGGGIGCNFDLTQYDYKFKNGGIS